MTTIEAVPNDSGEAAPSVGLRRAWLTPALAATLVVPIGHEHPTPRSTAVPVVIPFELRGDMALLKVQVNGQNALLILDTGSGISVLDTAFARSADVAMSPHEAHAHGSRNAMMQLGQAREVRLGAVTLSDLRVATADLSAVQARVGHDVRGTLGYELFTRYVVDVDYAARTVTLTEPTAFKYAGPGTVLPINTQSRVPVVDASIVTRTKGSVPVRLILDMGSSSWALRLGTRIVDQHDLDRDTVAVMGPFGAGVGGFTEGKLMRLPGLELGGLRIARPSAALSQEPNGAFGTGALSDGTIGVPVLRRTRLIVDYSRSRVILEPRGRLDVPDSVDASGLSLTSDATPARSLRVSYVIAGSAGARAGVRVGDELLAIDSQPVSSLTMYRARALLRAAGRTRRLSLRRDGRPIEVSVLLRAIL